MTQTVYGRHMSEMGTKSRPCGEALDLAMAAAHGLIDAAAAVVAVVEDVAVAADGRDGRSSESGRSGEGEGRG